MIKSVDKVICIYDVVNTHFEKGNIYEVSAIVSHDWSDNVRSKKEKEVLLDYFKMIKVVSLFSNNYITQGKMYDASLAPTIIDQLTMQPIPARYYLICDDEKGRIYECSNFITVAEWREKQMKTILMIKIMCINNNDDAEKLDISVIYLCEEDSWNKADKYAYIVVFDEGINIPIGVFRKTRFISIAEWREQQIKSVLDD